VLGKKFFFVSDRNENSPSPFLVKIYLNLQMGFCSMRLCLFIILAVVGLISAVLGFLSFIFVPKFIDCQVKEVYCLNFLISIGKGGVFC